ncbi:MAG: cupin domain-containing protein [Chthoniobacterales bacterium]
MNRATVDALSESESKSPNGKYHFFRKNLSQAVGGKKDIGTWGGGHSFDVEMYRIPSGAENFPFHAHAAQSEMYIFVSGCGSVRGPSEKCDVKGGDFMMFSPGEAHSIANTGDDDLVFYVIADNPQADVISYPDTGKWMVKPERRCFTMQETEYYEKGD